MRLSIKAAALVGALITGGSVLFFGILNLIFPAYANGFLSLMASIYPGFHHPGNFGTVIVGTLYGLVDGYIGGVIIAWLYNVFVPKQTSGA
jgi:hypothetical protein